MKKIFVLLTLVFTVMMSTVLVDAREVVSGAYVCGDKDAFSRVGDITIEWDPDVTNKVNLTDGNVDEWAQANYSPTQIIPENMVSWMGNDGKPANGGEGEVDSGMPDGWCMTTFFVADKDALYIAFYIVDPDVCGVDPVKPEEYWNGDSFQINIDFGRKLSWIIENDPDIADMLTNTKNVFYSFGYNGEGTPITIYVQESDDERILTPEDGVVGSTGKTDNGWCAEFCLPWQVMYDDYAFKSYLENVEDSRIYVGGAEKQNLEIGAGLYYVNHATMPDGSHAQVWGAGTHSGVTDLSIDASGAPLISWDAYDNAMDLVLEYEEGMEFSSPNIQVLGEDETLPDEVKTEPVTDVGTELETEPETMATSGTESRTESETTKETTSHNGNEASGGSDKTGCTSVLNTSVLSFILLLAGLVVYKKDKS